VGPTSTSARRTASIARRAGPTSAFARRTARTSTPFGRRASTPATPDDGAPGPSTQYGPTFYGGFLLDPDGNSVEAVHGDRRQPVPDGRIDHLWIRVRDLQASRRFYATIAPHAGIALGDDEPARVQFAGQDYTFSLIDDERPLTEHVHLAFPAADDATVRAFHAAALAAGYADHGAPGERAIYHHPGYYGAFVLDPDGHNVEVVNHNR
jgi:catechol 2,3-dioxygenase-like lactoylglutathione lyase family enzyme